MATFSASALATLFSSYSITRGPKTITIHNASALAPLFDVTVTGTLIGRQFTQIGADGHTRSFEAPANGKRTYPKQADGDIHFSVGTQDGDVHVPCEIQNAQPWLINKVNDSIGKQVEVKGSFRCLFEHPGFFGKVDAHIFEIHPVRALKIGGEIEPFDVGAPQEPDSIRTWADASAFDAGMSVIANTAQDSLEFHGPQGRDHNYVKVSGKVGNIKLHPHSSKPSEFTFNSTTIGHPIQTYCMKSTTSALQLSQLNDGDKIRMIALRNLDLPQAIKGNYVINLLGVDLKA